MRGHRKIMEYKGIYPFFFLPDLDLLSSDLIFWTGMLKFIGNLSFCGLVFISLLPDFTGTSHYF